MCLPLIFIVVQVLALECVTPHPYKDYIPVEELTNLSSESIEAYYNNAQFYNPWFYQNMLMRNTRSPYQQTTEPVTFGGRVKAKGGVSITGGFGNNGYGTFTSCSAPSTPFTVTSQPAFPTTFSLAKSTLPTITTLPTVNVPSTTISYTFIDNVPSTVSVPTVPMPFIVVTTTIPNNNGQNGNVASPVKFGGMVPASGRVKISAHFC